MKYLKLSSFIICIIMLFQFNATFVLSQDKCLCNTTTGVHFKTCPLAKIQPIRQYTVYVRNYDELLQALKNEKVTNIEILQNISINNTLKINKNIVITGNGYSISHNGFNKSVLKDTAFSSNIPMIEINGDINAEIDNLHIIGGFANEKVAYGISKNSSGVLSLSNVIIENCLSQNGGSAINSKQGTVILKDCNLNKNISENGTSAILNNGLMIIDGSSITQNISFCKDKTYAGSIQSLDSSKLYINNSTIAKNISLGSGGGINISGGELYALNCNVVGNVSLNNDVASSGISFTNKSSGKLANNIIIGNYNNSKDFKFSNIASQPDCNISGYYNYYNDKNKILKDKTNKRSSKNIGNLIATEKSLILNNLSDDYKNIQLDLPVFINLPNNVNVVGVKSEKEFSNGCKTVFDYDDINNIICGYIKKNKLYFLSGEKDYNMNVVTTVQGDGTRSEGLVGSTLYDAVIDENISIVSVPKIENGFVDQYDFWGKTINKNEVITLTAIPYDGYRFETWQIDDKSAQLFDSKLTDQTIKVSVTKKSEIKPIFKKDNRNYCINLISDYKDSYSFLTNKDGKFFIKPSMLKTIDNKILTGFSTRPDGTGEIYLVGKTYTTTKNLNLYAVWCEYGYGFITGHTIANSKVQLIGRDDYYLGFTNAGRNGDYVIVNIIPSYRQQLIIKNSRGNVITKELLETKPITLELATKISESYSKEDKKQENLQADNSKPVDLKEQETEKKKDTKEENREEINTDKNEEKQNINENNEQQNTENVDNIIYSLNKLLESNVSYKWEPDVEAKINEIENLKMQYNNLTEDEKNFLSPEQKDEITQYINALDSFIGE